MDGSSVGSGGGGGGGGNGNGSGSASGSGGRSIRDSDDSGDENALDRSDGRQSRLELQLNATVPSGSGQKKSWSELKSIVNDMRRQMTSLASMFPMNVNFRTLSDGRTRVYFLSPPASNGWDTVLFYTDVPASENDNCAPMRLEWNPVLEPIVSHLSTNNSREVQLLLERKRLSIWGITSYELHKSSGKIVFPACNTLYQCLDTGYGEGTLFPSELRIFQRSAAIDPQICPQNSDLVAYVCNGDIWVIHTVSGHSERLTFAHDGRRSFAEDPLTAGVPSYVMQEEFSRYQGFWWQPSSDDEIYRIVYEEVDESDVSLYTFPSSQSVGGDYEEYRFPRAGSANAKSKLKLVQFRLSESLKITDTCIKEQQCPLTYAFPWLEYVVRIGWTPDSNYVWAQLVNRVQQRLDLVLIPLDNFCELYSSSTPSPPESGSRATPDVKPSSSSILESSNDYWKSPLARLTRPMQVIYSETSSSWVNVHDVLHFLEITEDRVVFLWASEETGFRHLYLVTSSLATSGFNIIINSTSSSNSSSSTGTSNGSNSSNHKVDNINHNNHCHHTRDGSTLMEGVNNNNQAKHAAGRSTTAVHIDGCGTLEPRIVNKIALTSGDWEVLGRNVWVDKRHQLVYFMGLRQTPLEKHLYVVNMLKPNWLRLLTVPGYSFTVEFNDDCTMFLQTYCNIQTLPSWELVHIKQNCSNGNVAGLELISMGYLFEGGPSENTQFNPTIYSPRLASGESIYAMVFKPHNFTLGVKYPTVLNVYGGPEVQTVSNTFKGMRQLRMHMLAAQGYCVVCVDSRGSRHRGVRFESHIRGRMGTVELSDQVEVLKMLAEQLGYIDMDRVAIHGWSYGGYLSLMGLVQYPEIFKLSIAGAPVTSWEYYDTGYTERYMDLPDNNRSGYTAGSVLSYIHKFPDEDNRLLIIHGLIDENVHFFHTSQLVNGLIKANKPYQLQVYPNERHSLRNLEASKHYETKLLSFLQNHL
ncbi:dipeptidyl peptidase 9 [Topomyia yanbarensis]|uniref:dipeptidyl peptidase 9 n=1 Tax=Topomyia yanbarensis TaxID=2498891 RepID=UPI00273C0589|nr:dipeptidyl peptidase 9 [Topomyia yanbarensis]